MNLTTKKMVFSNKRRLFKNTPFQIYPCQVTHANLASRRTKCVFPRTPYGIVKLTSCSQSAKAESGWFADHVLYPVQGTVQYNTP